jgi:hypothetical protein
MNAPMLTLMAIGAIALIFVIGPVALDAYLRFRGKRTVGCPETGLAAEIGIDAWHAAATAVPGPPSVHVAECSLWPAHEGCGQECVEHPEVR